MIQELHTKECSKCHQIKPLLDFHFRKESKIYRLECKKCFNSSIKQHRLNNPQIYKERDKQKYLKNKTKIINNIKKWSINNPQKIRLYKKRCKQNNLNIKIADNIRSRISCALKNNTKSTHTFELLGCNIQEYRNYLEKQFTNGMTWCNYGNKIGQWSIDHITPCIIFDLSDPIEQKQCFHYSNTRPLWHIDNLKKHNKIIV